MRGDPHVDPGEVLDRGTVRVRYGSDDKQVSVSRPDVHHDVDVEGGLATKRYVHVMLVRVAGEELVLWSVWDIRLDNELVLERGA